MPAMVVISPCASAKGQSSVSLNGADSTGSKICRRTKGAYSGFEAGSAGRRCHSQASYMFVQTSPMASGGICSITAWHKRRIKASSGMNDGPSPVLSTWNLILTPPVYSRQTEKTLRVPSSSTPNRLGLHCFVESIGNTPPEVPCGVIMEVRKRGMDKIHLSSFDEKVTVN